LVKLLQIAHNVGQVESEIAKRTYSDEIVKFYNANNLGYINTFVGDKYAKTIVKKTARMRNISKTRRCRSLSCRRI
jgi:hypothetical protein